MLTKQRFVDNTLQALRQSAKENILERAGRAGLRAAHCAGSAAAGDTSPGCAAFGRPAGTVVVDFRGVEDESLGGLLCAVPSPCHVVQRVRSVFTRCWRLWRLEGGRCTAARFWERSIPSLMAGRDTVSGT